MPLVNNNKICLIYLLIDWLIVCAEKSYLFSYRFHLYDWPNLLVNVKKCVIQMDGNHPLMQMTSSLFLYHINTALIAKNDMPRWVRI